MKTFKALLQREYWEHRGAFLKTPLIIGVVMSVILVLFYLTTDRFAMKMSGGELADFGAKSLDSIEPSKIQFGIDVFMLGSASLYHFVLFFILFFYMLGSLYDDRKDGSILFWKSLPISDTQTVLSKLVTATIVTPLIFVAGVIISHLLFFVILSLILLLYGINPFTVLWANVNYVTNWGAFTVGCLMQALWLLPVYGWFLFASSFSKRRPFLIAVFVPVMFGFVWYWYNALVNFNMLQAGVFKTIGIYLARGFSPFTSGLEFSAESVDFDATEQTGSEVIVSMMNGFSNPDLYYGAVFGIIMTAVAIYVRRFRNTT